MQTAALIAEGGESGSEPAELPQLAGYDNINKTLEVLMDTDVAFGKLCNQLQVAELVSG